MAVKKFSISSSIMQGLEDTISSAEDNAGKLRYEVIKLEKIDLDEENPRDLKLSVQDIVNGISKSDPYFDRKMQEREDLISLASSIESEGLINPVFVYQKGNRYKLIAGERRTLASYIAKKTTIQARIADKKPESIRVAILQWAENVERKDLNLLERRDNLIKIRDAIHSSGESQFDAKIVMQSLGCSTSQAYRYLSLINADDEVLNLIEENHINSLKDVDKVVSAKTREARSSVIQTLMGNIKFDKTVANKPKPLAPINRVGRKQTRVNFGSTKDIEAANEVINILLKDKRLKPLKDKLEQSESDYYQLSTVFSMIVKALSSKENA